MDRNRPSNTCPDTIRSNKVMKHLNPITDKLKHEIFNSSWDIIVKLSDNKETNVNSFSLDNGTIIKGYATTYYHNKALAEEGVSNHVHNRLRSITPDSPFSPIWRAKTEWGHIHAGGFDDINMRNVLNETS